MEGKITKDNFHWIWKKILIHATDKYEVQPVVVKIGHSTISTLGNFSASTGKSKSRKTFNVSAIVAAALTNQKVLNYSATFPEEKRKVLYFDTEQSPYHCLRVLKRILHMAGFPDDRDYDDVFEFVMLREYSPIERRQIIDLALAERTDVGLVVIDGLRDLLYDINSSSESQEVIGLLMRWTSQYNIHIHTVLHLNKGDDNVRGHIGTELNHKAETVLQIKINEGNENISEVHATLIRDKTFPPFAFRINDEDEPEKVEGLDLRKKQKNESLNYRTIPETMHRNALDAVFGFDKANPNSALESYMYSQLIDKMIVEYKEAGFERKRSCHVDLLKLLIKRGVIIKDDRLYYYNKDWKPGTLSDD